MVQRILGIKRVWIFNARSLSAVMLHALPHISVALVWVTGLCANHPDNYLRQDSLNDNIIQLSWQFMATVVFTQNLRRHVNVERAEIQGATVAEAFGQLFDDYPRMRGYLLDDTGGVRTHVAILVNGESIKDRQTLSDTLPASAEIFVVQALSGG